MPSSASATASTAADARVSLIVVAAFIAIWPLILRKLGGDDVYRFLGPFSLAIIIVLTAIRRSWWRGRAASSPHLRRNIGIGIAVGATMTVGTHVAYHLCVSVAPSLAGHVTGLYRATRTTGFGIALAWTAVVVVAEELLWRGAFLGAASRVFTHRIAGVLSLATYTAVQFGTGSWVVVLAAFVCGVFWTAERLLTGSLVPSLVSHAIWTFTIIHFYPVTTSWP
jgi:membrane protease YdiL (CAAX protease family)